MINLRRPGTSYRMNSPLFHARAYFTSCILENRGKILPLPAMTNIFWTYYLIHLFSRVTSNHIPLTCVTPDITSNILRMESGATTSASGRNNSHWLILIRNITMFPHWPKFNGARPIKNSITKQHHRRGETAKTIKISRITKGNWSRTRRISAVARNRKNLARNTTGARILQKATIKTTRRQTRVTKLCLKKLDRITTTQKKWTMSNDRRKLLLHRLPLKRRRTPTISQTIVTNIGRMTSAGINTVVKVVLIRESPVDFHMVSSFMTHEGTLKRKTIAGRKNILSGQKRQKKQSEGVRFY